MNRSFTIRDAAPGDAEQIAQLYYDTVHTVNARDYTAEQIDAWAPAVWPTEGCAARQRDRMTFVADAAGVVLGFAELYPTGHIDCFYCHHAHLGRGVGRALMERIFARARELGLRKLDAEVSITAEPFFQRMGFEVTQRQRNERHGVVIPNAVIVRSVTDPS